MAKSYAPIQHPIAELTSSRVSNVTKPWTSWFKTVQDTLQTVSLYGANQTFALTAGTPYQIPDNVSIVLLTPAADLATGTVIMPVNPQDKQQLQISSTKQIMTLTVQAPAGQTLLNSPLSISARTRWGFSYQYSATNSTWYRLL